MNQFFHGFAWGAIVISLIGIFSIRRERRRIARWRHKPTEPDDE